MKIEIAAMGNVPQLLLHRLPEKLVETFETITDECFLISHETLPTTAYNAQRRQYRAEAVLHHLLRRTARDRVILGIVAADLYASNLNFVFGLSQVSGRVALVSIYRLGPVFYGQPPDLEVLWERTQKETIHEMGHVFGLSHCIDPKCVMSFSNSILDVDRKSSNFCHRCRVKLYCRP